MDLPCNIWNPLSSIRFSKWIEGIALQNINMENKQFITRYLILREQLEPLLKEFIEIVSHLLMGSGHLVTE